MYLNCGYTNQVFSCFRFENNRFGIESKHYTILRDEHEHLYWRN